MRAATRLRTGICLTGLWMIAAFLVAGCAIPFFPSDRTPIASASPTLSTLLPSPMLLSSTSTSQIQASYDCGYQWANQALIDLTGQAQAAIDAAGLQGVTVLVSAFGENCLDESGIPVSFLDMQTDFHLTVEAASLQDTAALGEKLADALVVLSQFPPESTPGPMPGRISVCFTDGEKELYFPVGWQDAQNALAAGLTGQLLWDDLHPKNSP